MQRKNNSLSGLNKKKFTDVNFDKQNFAEKEIAGAVFSGCSFKHADFSGAATVACQFINCDFTLANLSSSIHKHSAFLNCKFDGGNLFMAVFNQCKMKQSLQTLHCLMPIFAGQRLTGLISAL